MGQQKMSLIFDWLFRGGGSHLNLDRLVVPRSPVVCDFGMGRSCTVRLQATRAEGTFRSVGESYDVFVGVVRCKKRLSGRVAKMTKTPGSNQRPSR